MESVAVPATVGALLCVRVISAHEPVIPHETDLLVAVAGIDALGRSIEKVAHRPELVCEIVGVSPEETFTPETLGKLLASSRGGMKYAEDASRAAVLINKVESPSEWEAARETAQCILREPRVERVAIGAIKGKGATGWEVFTRR